MGGTQKLFLLDTNVYLHDPEAIYKFENNVILIPFEILEELDNIKNRKDNTGKNAREIIRNLNQFIEDIDGVKEVELPEIEFVNSAELISRTDNKEIKKLYYSDGVDNKLLAISLAYSVDEDLNPSQQSVIFVSKDINSRLKANTVGITAQDYYSDKIDVYELEKKNKKIINVDKEIIDKLYKVGSISKSEFSYQIRGLYENMPIIFRDIQSSQSALAYYRSNNFYLINSNVFQKHNIKPLSVGQSFALQFLFDSSITGVAIFSQAGSGKTYITLSSALAQMPDRYKKIVITKPVIPVGRDIGYLPGLSSQKMYPWLGGYMDNIEQILAKDPRISGKHSDSDVYENREDLWEYLIESGVLEIQPITYIRGRSFVDSFVIIDESANLTVHEVKTILTRIGKNSKVVLLGDINQIDSPYLDKYSNGLVQSIAKLKGIPEFAYVTLDKVIRSNFVEQVIKRL